MNWDEIDPRFLLLIPFCLVIGRMRLLVWWNGWIWWWFLITRVVGGCFGGWGGGGVLFCGSRGERKKKKGEKIKLILNDFKIKFCSKIIFY